MTKEEARQWGRTEKKKHTDEDIRSRSRAAICRLKELDRFQEAERIFVYVSCNRELDTRELIADCLAQGRTVLVPKVYGLDMHFHEISSLDMLVPGTKNIPEPCNHFRPEWEEKGGLMIMPGLAFDRQCNRAGYGGGFYDRYLNAHTEFYKIALCFDFQLVESIAAEPHDRKPDRIITETQDICRTEETWNHLNA